MTTVSEATLLWSDRLGVFGSCKKNGWCLGMMEWNPLKIVWEGMQKIWFSVFLVLGM